MNNTVHSLWIGKRLPRLQRLAIESWIRFGYQYRLFVYDAIDNAPGDVVLLDGADVLPTVHRYQDDAHRGNPALQANLFRYAWLYERGGMWADADSVCLGRLPERSLIISSEPHRTEPYWFPDLALTKIPPRSALMETCRDMARQRLAAGRQTWGLFGPKLLIEALKACGLYSDRYVSPPRDHCPVPCWLAAEMWRPHALAVPKNSRTIHIWSEASKARGFSIDSEYPPDSLVEQIWRHVFQKGDQNERDSRTLEAETPFAA